MKSISKSLTAILLLSFVAACTKVEKLPFYEKGKSVTLSSSTTTIAPSAADSNKVVLTLNWTDPEYATDPSNQKFVMEMDADQNFPAPKRFEVSGALEYSFTGLQLNNMLADFGFNPGDPFTINIRVISSYGNNNERYASNVVSVSMTPYLIPLTLTPSTNGPLVLGVSQASSNAISFSWNSSNYGNHTIYYAIQIDKAGGDFSSPVVVHYGTATSGNMSVNDLNTYAINAGVAGGDTDDLQFRVVSYMDDSYTTALVKSAVVTITTTTYVPIPDNLYIVGDATLGWWNNPVPVPQQQFTRVDAYSFSINVWLIAGGSYLFLPVNGDWSHKYGGATDGTEPGGATLLKDNAVPGSNTPAPPTTGVYKITVNFQTNKFTVTPVQVPDNLYIVGDATPGGWDNPVAVPAQQFTKIDAATFAIVINLNAGGSYLFLPVNGDWGHKFGGSTDGTEAGGGILKADGAVPGSNTPAPSTSGLYKIEVSFATNTYKVTPYSVPENLYIVGDATPGWWNNPVPVPDQQFTRISGSEFTLDIHLTAGGTYLFLPVNGSWDHKFGGATDGTQAGGGDLKADGDVPGSNTPAPGTTGNYRINVNFLTWKYTVTPI
ncbi:MAG: SusE domain-containing protein [Chitinophagaceae bacterium]|nr:SusE domain-containing protein [Chitinophagaceae bacterium]